MLRQRVWWWAALIALCPSQVWAQAETDDGETAEPEAATTEGAAESGSAETEWESGPWSLDLFGYVRAGYEVVNADPPTRASTSSAPTADSWCTTLGWGSPLGSGIWA
jgi:hypothetical protein